MFLTEIHGYHIISNRRYDFSFVNGYIIVHNKNILKKINMQAVFDEMWYIVEYPIVNIFYFLIMFDWGKKYDNHIYTSFLNST